MARRVEARQGLRRSISYRVRVQSEPITLRGKDPLSAEAQGHGESVCVLRDRQGMRVRGPACVNDSKRSSDCKSGSLGAGDGPAAEQGDAEKARKKEFGTRREQRQGGAFAMGKRCGVPRVLREDRGSDAAAREGGPRWTVAAR